MKQVCYIATHVHTSVCMNVGTCVCMRRVSALLCVGAMYPPVRYDMICMWERMHAPHTTLHQGQFFCDVLLCSVKFHPPFITILFVRNCFPTSFDDMMYVRTHACATSPLCALLDSQTPHMKQNACVCEPKTHAWANLQNACVSEPVTNTNTSHLQNIYQHVMWSHVF